MATRKTLVNFSNGNGVPPTHDVIAGDTGDLFGTTSSNGDGVAIEIRFLHGGYKAGQLCQYRLQDCRLCQSAGDIGRPPLIWRFGFRCRRTSVRHDRRFGARNPVYKWRLTMLRPGQEALSIATPRLGTAYPPPRFTQDRIRQPRPPATPAT